MASLNKVFLMGNLTRETALRFTPGGSAVCEFGLAMNRKYSSNGQEKEEVCFVDIVVWGKQAESCDRFLEKGAPVLIEGRLQYDQWDDRDTGGKRSRLRVTADRVQFLPRGNKDDAQSGGGYSQQSQSQPQSQPQSNYSQPPQNGGYSRPQDSRPQSPAAPTPAPAPAPARDEFPPPPMPNNAFSVDDEMQDDIPF